MILRMKSKKQIEKYRKSKKQIEKFGKLKEWGEKAIDTISSGGRKAIDSITSGTRGVIGSITSEYEKIISESKKLIDKLKDGGFLTDFINKIINAIKNPIVDTFKNIFNMDFISSEIMKIVNKVRNSLEIPINSTLNKLKSSLENIFKQIKGSIEMITKQIPIILLSIQKTIKKMFEIFIEMMKRMLVELTSKFKQFGQMFMNIIKLSIIPIKNMSFEVTNTIMEVVNKIKNFEQILHSSGPEFTNKYIKPIIDEYMGDYIKIMTRFYSFDFIMTQHNSSISNCVGSLLNQIDDILWNMSPSILKIYLKNQTLRKPQCKSEFLDKIYKFRVFIDKNKIFSLISFCLLYIGIFLNIKFLFNGTTDIIPNYIIISFIILTYFNFVIDSYNARKLLIIFDNFKQLIPNKLLTMHAQNYTMFIMIILLLGICIKLIYNFIYNKITI